MGSSAYGKGMYKNVGGLEEGRVKGGGRETRDKVTPGWQKREDTTTNIEVERYSRWAL